MITRKVFMENWMPVVLTGLITGGVAGIVVPKVEANANKQLAEYSIKQSAHSRLSLALAQFIDVYSRWRRVSLKSTDGLNREEITTLIKRSDNLEARLEAAAVELSVALELAETHFGPNFDTAADNFRQWMNTFREVPIKESPEASRLRKWRENLNQTVQQEL